MAGGGGQQGGGGMPLLEMLVQAVRMQQAGALGGVQLNAPPGGSQPTPSAAPSGMAGGGAGGAGGAVGIVPSPVSNPDPFHRNPSVAPGLTDAFSQFLRGNPGYYESLSQQLNSQ